MRAQPLLAVLALLATGLAAAQPAQEGSVGATDVPPALALEDRAERDNLFGAFARTDRDVAGRWVSFRYDDRGALSNVSIAIHPGPPAPDGLPPADATGAGAAPVWALIDVDPFRATNGPARGGTAATAILSNATGLFQLRGRTAEIEVHNTPLAEVHVAALEALNVTLQPAPGIVWGSAGSHVWTVQGNGIDGRLVLVGQGPLAGTPTTTFDPVTGATQEQMTVALRPGEHLLFLARAPGAEDGFDALVQGLAEGTLGARLGLVGDGVQALWHPLQLGIRLGLDRAIPAEMALLASDDRADAGLCTPSAAPPPATEPAPGATGATATPPCLGYAVLLRVDLDGIDPAGKNLRVLVDQRPAARAASLGEALQVARGGATAGPAGAPQGQPPQPGVEETTPSTTGQGTTETGGPGSQGGSSAPNASAPAPEPGLGVAFVRTSPLSPRVVEVLVGMPAGDHRVILTTSSAGAALEPREGRPLNGFQPPGDGAPAGTPGPEAVAVTAVAVGIALAARRRR